IESLYKEMKEVEKENASLSAKLSNMQASSILDQVDTVNGISLLAVEVDGKDMNQLRGMVDELKQKLGSGVILLATVHKQKVQLAAGISEDLIEKGLHAGNLIKQAAQACGGGGGGRPDMAQAGGKDPAKINDALQSASEYIQKNV